jgi:hypothetical protein
VTLQFDYHSGINEQDIPIQINTGNDPDLASVPASQQSIKASTSNNQALVYYSDPDYGLAKIAEYVALLLAICALLMLLIGLFGGKLIGLECAGVIQLSFISLLSMTDLSPTATSLLMLKYSLGYNSLRSYNTSQNMSRPLKAAELN